MLESVLEEYRGVSENLPSQESIASFSSYHSLTEECIRLEFQETFARVSQLFDSNPSFEKKN